MTKKESGNPEQNSAMITWEQVRERMAGIRAGTIEPNEEEKRTIEERIARRKKRQLRQKRTKKAK